MKKKNRDIVMTVRFTQAEAKTLRKAASKHGLSLSSVIRQCCFRPSRTKVIYQQAYGTASNAGVDFNFDASNYSS
jgi:hypothetical protein